MTARAPARASRPLLRTALLLAASCAVSVAHAAPDAATAQRELERARARIGQLESVQARDLSKRGAALKALRDAEREAAKAARALAKVQGELDEEQRALDAARREQTEAERRLQAEKHALARQVRAAYAAGREEKIKLLLNQQDPAAVQRTLVYYDYYHAARGARIARVDELRTRLATLATSIGERVARLETMRAERARAAAELRATRDARGRLVRELDTGIRDRKQRLARLGQEAQRLTRLIESLDDVFKDIPAEAGDARPFAQSRGRLPWPSRGRVLANFGEQRPGGRLRWDGLLIGAQAGEPVRAVARGRVAYADWLPHYGLLLILEHGDGWLSLYGHNQQVHKRAGDWVERGEVIANIGDSGGQQSAALYFEIRKGKEPQDPRVWMAKR